MQQPATTKIYTKLHILALAVLSLIITWALLSHSATGITYSSGTYGTCAYNTCGITMVTSGTVSADITPVGGSTRCTVSSDTVTVTSGASSGYTVKLSNMYYDNLLEGPGSGPSARIFATSGTSASPSTLTANTWGFRVDGIGGFGAGPTSSLSSGAIPSLKFASVPSSMETPELIRTTNVADTGTVNTLVWYGVCANTSVVSGAYTGYVTYTAVIN